MKISVRVKFEISRDKSEQPAQSDSQLDALVERAEPLNAFGFVSQRKPPTEETRT